MAVRKSKNGTWIADVSSGTNPITLIQRRIVRKGFKTKKEALEAERYLRSVELKEKNFGAKITIDMLYQLLKEEDEVNNRKKSYIDTQENNYQFREHLREKNAKNSEKKLSPNTINKIIVLLKKILDVGLRKGYYKEHPVGLLKKLPIEKRKMQFWTVKEFKHFLSLFKNDEYNLELLFTVLFFTGLRLGEALALTWKDIEFSTSTIHVSKSMYVNKGEEHISSTKTKSGTRRIIINKKLIETLEGWKKEQTERLREFSTDTEKLQIFQDSPITLTKNSIEKQYKKILARDSSLKKIRIHDFRHSHASLLINQGEDYLIVKERLGHASITTTIDTYSHLYPSKQKDLADKLDNLL